MLKCLNTQPSTIKPSLVFQWALVAHQIYKVILTSFHQTSSADLFLILLVSVKAFLVQAVIQYPLLFCAAIHRPDFSSTEGWSSKNGNNVHPS